MAKKLAKDPKLYEAMQIQINNLIHKGYATKIEAANLQDSPKTWYLPIFIALNPNKPQKLRLVWDAASKSNGKSLNDFLLSGPDLLQPLVQVLLSFRTGKIAICGDIAEMFHRINISKDDAQAQRFLWMENPKSLKPSIYVMTALSFGMSCAPFIAHYVRDFNADKFSKKYPIAVKSIKCHHYVDDMIDCADTDQDALELANQVSNIHQHGGFHIRNWISNSPEVLQSLAKNADCTGTKEWELESNKVLGMYWDAANDVFRYNCRFARLRRNVFENDINPTRVSPSTYVNL